MCSSQPGLKGALISSYPNAEEDVFAMKLSAHRVEKGRSQRNATCHAELTGFDGGLGRQFSDRRQQYGIAQWAKKRPHHEDQLKECGAVAEEDGSFRDTFVQGVAVDPKAQMLIAGWTD